MNVVHIGYKYRIYPNESQKLRLHSHFKACDSIWNHFLNRRKENYLKEKTTLNYYDTSKELTELKKCAEYRYLKDISSQALQQTLRDLDVAYKRFFTKIAKFPKFKDEKSKHTFSNVQYVSIKNGRVYLPKFRDGIKIKYHRPLNGKIIRATVSLSPPDRFYIGFLCEAPYIPYSKTGKAVGIDTGIKVFATMSDTTTIENKNFLNGRIKKISFLHRQLRKKRKGSAGWRRIVEILQIEYRKLSDVREDFLNKVTTEIVRKYDIICVEDLAIKQMMSCKYLARAFSDVSLGEFYTKLEYKSDWNDRQLVKIDRYFPSSKTCSICGYINQDLSLSQRTWVCDECHTSHNRDFNASVNILVQGLNLLSVSGTDSDTKQKQVEALSLDKSMKPEIAKQ